MSESNFQARVITLRGHIPLECSFAVRGVIYRWGSTTPLLATIIENNALYQGCLDFLYQEGKEFASLDEAIMVATRDKWPNWEKLL